MLNTCVVQWWKNVFKFWIVSHSICKKLLFTFLCYVLINIIDLSYMILVGFYLRKYCNKERTTSNMAHHLLAIFHNKNHNSKVSNIWYQVFVRVTEWKSIKLYIEVSLNLNWKLNLYWTVKPNIQFIFKIDLQNVEVISWLLCVWLADVRRKSRYCFDWKIFTIKMKINSKLVGFYNLQKINEPCSNALMQRTPNGNVINAQYLNAKRLAIVHFKFL